MTTEEKLEKAVAFIKGFEQMSFPVMTTSDIVDTAHGYCSGCGEVCDIDFTGPDVDYVEAKELQLLKDKAWHLLADLA